MICTFPIFKYCYSKGWSPCYANQYRVICINKL
nr:MAG TPA: hypothetical protein [Caudoviricetes sp.]